MSTKRPIILLNTNSTILKQHPKPITVNLILNVICTHTKRRKVI